MIGSWWIRLRRGLGRLVSGQSLQWRLALLTGISVALSVLVVGTTSYVVTRWSLLEQLDRGWHAGWCIPYGLVYPQCALGGF